MLRRLHADDTQDFNDAIHSPVLLLEEEEEEEHQECNRVKQLRPQLVLYLDGWPY